MDNKLSTGNNYPNSTKEPTYLIPNKQKQLSSGIQIILPNLQLEKIDLNKNIRELLEINKWHTTEDEWHLTEDEWHLTEDESS